ncbi:MAG: phosphomannomutase/phosphoglucomutase [Patescibacteria group bacterium]
MIASSAFRAYDVRGIVPADFDAKGAYTLGRSIGVYLKNKHLVHTEATVLVHRDARKHSEELAQFLIEGLLAEGMDVIDGGLATTPMHIFALNQCKADAGVMVTASHNPPQYHGFKISSAGGVPISSESGLSEIQAIASRNVFADGPIGKKNERNFVSQYVAFLAAQHAGTPRKRLRVVFDLGNGMTTLVLRDLLDKLPIDPVLLYDEMNMISPTHQANPHDPNTLEELRARVLSEHADLGIAFDGDGDRIGVIDERGNIIRSDMLGAWIADMELTNIPHATLVHDVSCSHAVRDVAARHHGRAVRERVGHSFMKRAMRASEAVFGVEASGHFYWKDFFYSDGALFTFIRILAYLDVDMRGMHAVTRAYHTYASSGEITVPLGTREMQLEELAHAYSTAERIDWLDGLTIEYVDWWANIRFSNTEPVVRIVIEARDETSLSREKQQLLSVLGV